MSSAEIQLQTNETSTNPCTNQITSAIIHETTNKRIYDRVLPSHMLQPYLDVRPVSTKYSFLPIVDPRTPPQVPLVQQPTFHTEEVFNPGNTTSPWSGFSSQVNVESELRNQIYALQKCNQAVYVPSSRSDLYEERFPLGDMSQQNAHPYLFEQEHFKCFNPNPENVGQQLFLNNTRMQLKDVQQKQVEIDTYTNTMNSDSYKP